MVKSQNGKILGFLSLTNSSRVDLSFDTWSETVLIGFEDNILKMSFKEFKTLVEALKKYIEYVENHKERKTEYSVLEKGKVKGSVDM